MAQTCLQGGPLSPIEAMSSADSLGTSCDEQSESESPASRTSGPAAAGQQCGAARDAGSSAREGSCGTRASSSEGSGSPDLRVSMPPFNQVADIERGGLGDGKALEAVALAPECQADSVDSVAHDRTEATSAAPHSTDSNHEDPKSSDVAQSPQCETSSCESAAREPGTYPLAKPAAPGSKFCDAHAGAEAVPDWETAYSSPAWTKGPHDLVKHASDTTVHSDIDKIGASGKSLAFGGKVQTHMILLPPCTTVRC